MQKKPINWNFQVAVSIGLLSVLLVGSLGDRV